MTNKLTPELQAELDSVNQDLDEMSSYRDARHIVESIRDALRDPFERRGKMMICVGVPSSSEIYMSRDLGRALRDEADASSSYDRPVRTFWI